MSHPHTPLKDYYVGEVLSSWNTQSRENRIRVYEAARQFNNKAVSGDEITIAIGDEMNNFSEIGLKKRDVKMLIYMLAFLVSKDFDVLPLVFQLKEKP